MKKLNKYALLGSIISFTLLLSISLSGCGVAYTTSKKYFVPDELTTAISEDIIAQNDNYVMSWDHNTASVIVANQKGDVVFSIMPQGFEGGVDEFGLPIKPHTWMMSPILITYMSPDTHDIRILDAYSNCVETGNYSIKEVERGIQVTYYFSDVEIAVPVNYVLDDLSLKISTDIGEVLENETMIESVSIAPFACNIKNNSSNEYLFVPSGSGALIYPTSYDEVGKKYKQEIYGDDAVRSKQSNLNYIEDQQVNLPVFGSKNDNLALCAIIDSGAESAEIEAWIGSTSVGFSSEYTTFKTRGYEWPSKQTKNAAQILSKNKADYIASVSYYFLDDEEANYVGIANCYRNYLIEENGLEHEDETSPLAVKMIGGTNTKESFLGVPYNAFYSTTTLDEAEKIINDIIKDTQVTPTVDLVGFGNGGLVPEKVAGGYGINKNLGTAKQLKAFFKRANQNNMNVFYDFNVTQYVKTGNGISIEDKAISSNGVATAQYSYDIWSRFKEKRNTKSYLTSRNKIINVVSDLVESTEKTGITAVGLSTLSNIAYSDYSNVLYFLKGNTERDVETAIKSIKDKGLKVAVNQANSYAAAKADYIFDSPIKSAEFFMFDIDVPFYQIVFKGYKPMAVSSLNLSTSAQTNYLKAVESGMALQFTLIDDYSVDLYNSKESSLSKSVYSGIKEQLKDYVLKYKEYYDKVKNLSIVSHTIYSENCVSTEFSDGSVVYVNYSEKEVAINDILIPKQDFIYKEGAR